MHPKSPTMRWQMALLAGLCLALRAQPSLAQGTDYLAKAKALYQNKQYQSAAGLVRAGMYKGVNNAAMWLLLAECYQKQGQTDAARQAVDVIAKHFPGSPEAAQAITLLGSSKGHQSVDTRATGAASGATSTTKEPPLSERVYVVPPKFGHPDVNSHTVTLIRAMVRALPGNIYKIMDQAHVVINVTPNLIDRFPDAVHHKHPTLGHYFSEEFGRTYGKDIYICERLASEPGGTALQNPMPDETIKATVYTQFSHALDCCLENPSKDKIFLALYKQDAEQADRSNSDLKGYLVNEEIGTNEVFGGLAAGMMGNNTQITRMLDANFPRCKAWIKSRIDALSK